MNLRNYVGMRFVQRERARYVWNTIEAMVGAITASGTLEELSDTGR